MTPQLHYRVLQNTYDGDYNPCKDLCESGVLEPGVIPDIPTGGCLDIKIGDQWLRFYVSEWLTFSWLTEK